MAKCDDKPVVCCLSRRIRIMKMGCAFYPQHNTITGNQAIPWLNMRGLWLRQAGLEMGQTLFVEVSHGRLVITPNKEDAR